MELIPQEILETILRFSRLDDVLSMVSVNKFYRKFKPSTLTDGQLNMLVAISDGKNIYVMGNAGTGKSYCVKMIRQRYKDKVLVSSTTGFSASMIQSSTIDSIMLIIKKSNNKPVFSRLIIDEASMIGDRKIKELDVILRTYYDNNIIFGGKQLILIGDPLQLPPVNDMPIFYSNYYKSFDLKIIRLREIKRQKDKQFADMLDMIRLGYIGDKVKTFMASLQYNVGSLFDEPMVVVATNNEVREINTQRLDSLGGPVYQYHRTIEITGNPDPVLYIETRLEVQLNIKIGARVMLLKNLDVNGGFTNGSRGIIIAITIDNLPVVEFEMHDGTKETKIIGIFTENQSYKNGIRQSDCSIDSLLLDATEDTFRGYTRSKVVIKQIPLSLCWATTVHKIQGCTLDNILIDCKSIKFPGQMYTALSRVSSKNGIQIRNFNITCIRADNELVKQLSELIKNNIQLVMKGGKDIRYDGFIEAQSESWRDLM
jgi:ATP-dependent DNA helicase PIF1